MFKATHIIHVEIPASSPTGKRQRERWLENNIDENDNTGDKGWKMLLTTMWNNDEDLGCVVMKKWCKQRG